MAQSWACARTPTLAALESMSSTPTDLTSSYMSQKKGWPTNHTLAVAEVVAPLVLVPAAGVLLLSVDNLRSLLRSQSLEVRCPLGRDQFPHNYIRISVIIPCISRVRLSLAAESRPT